MYDILCVNANAPRAKEMERQLVRSNVATTVDKVSGVASVRVLQARFHESRYLGGSTLGPLFLSFEGEVTSVSGDLGHGVGRVHFGEGERPHVQYDYRMSREEAASLELKGIRDADFDDIAQKQMGNVELAFPCDCDVTALPTGFVDVASDYPILIVDTRGVPEPISAADMRDVDRSFTDMASLFPDVPRIETPTRESVIQQEPTKDDQTALIDEPEPEDVEATDDVEDAKLVGVRERIAQATSELADKRHKAALAAEEVVRTPEPEPDEARAEPEPEPEAESSEDDTTEDDRSDLAAYLADEYDTQDDGADEGYGF